MKCEIVPFVGFESVHFGQIRAEIRSNVGEGFAPFQKASSEPTADAYDELGFHFYYDRADRLECIEAFEPADPTVVGISLIGNDLNAVIEALAEQGYFGKEIDVGYQFDEQGFSLFAPHSKIEGVTIFCRGYFGDEDA
jgi:hypothetical protein